MGYVIQNQELIEFARNCSLDLVLLTDSEGLPLASSSENSEQNEIHAAVLNKMQSFITKYSHELNFSTTSEMSIKDETGKTIVIRPFQSNHSEYAVVLLIADASKVYKRSLKKLIKSIQVNWSL